MLKFKTNVVCTAQTSNLIYLMLVFSIAYYIIDIEHCYSINNVKYLQLLNMFETFRFFFIICEIYGLDSDFQSGPCKPPVVHGRCGGIVIRSNLPIF